MYMGVHSLKRCHYYSDIYTPALTPSSPPTQPPTPPTRTWWREKIISYKLNKDKLVTFVGDCVCHITLQCYVYYMLVIILNWNSCDLISSMYAYLVNTYCHTLASINSRIFHSPFLVSIHKFRLFEWGLYPTIQPVSVVHAYLFVCC